MLRRAIDTHAHLFPKSAQLAPGAWHVPAHEATAEQYTALLEEHEIGGGVLAAASIFGTNNEYALRACERYPQLRTTVIVGPEISMTELRSMASRGAVGIRLQWRNVVQIPDLRDQGYRRLLANVDALGWHVQVHDDSRRLVNHLPLLEQAGVKVVVDHFGRPGPENGLSCPGFKRLLESIAKGKCWVKLSAGFRLGSPDLAISAASRLLEVAGPARLMWGSDWPFAAFESAVRYAQTITDLEDWVPEEKARRQILWDTPAEFYQIKSGY